MTDDGPFSIDELFAAADALIEFLNALRRRDDVTAAALLFPATAERNGFLAPNVCEKFLDSWGVDDEVLSHLGPTNLARVIDDELVAFGIVEGSQPELLTGPTRAKAMAMIKGQSGWQVWGAPDAEEFANPIHRVPLIRASGPMN